MEEMLKGFRRRWSQMMPTIQEGIEKNRKGDFCVLIQDKNGAPLDAKITVKQRKHKFDFGCNALLLGSLDSGENIYRNAITNIFNMVTTTFCWNITELSEGVFRFDEGIKEIFRRPPAERVLKFARENGLKIKGQPLLADSWYPEWAAKEPKKLRAQQKNYFLKVNERYGRSFYLFDVVNESYLCHWRTPHYPLRGDDEFQYVKWALKTAGDIFPKECIMERNETTHVNYGEKAQRYYNENKYLKENGIRLDAIGYQFHLFNGKDTLEQLINGVELSPQTLYSTYTKASELDIPIYITEITIPSVYKDMTNDQGEALQAEILENLYSLWFSIPKMRGIIYWNLKDGPAWNNEGDCLGCLMDYYMRKKPSYYVLENLIKRRWNTCEEGETENGKLYFRGFYGEYDITVTAASGETVAIEGCFNNSGDTVTVELGY